MYRLLSALTVGAVVTFSLGGCGDSSKNPVVGQSTVEATSAGGAVPESERQTGSGNEQSPETTATDKPVASSTTSTSGRVTTTSPQAPASTVRTTAPPPPASGSGIQGRVTRWPPCPAETSNDPDCAARALSGA